MTREEYAARLDALRKEYADAIRKAAKTLPDHALIVTSESEAHEYTLRVKALIEEYRA